MLPLDRREYIAALGGAAAVGLMSHEARADALEEALLARTSDAMSIAAAQVAAAQPYPTVAHMWRTPANPDAPL